MYSRYCTWLIAAFLLGGWWCAHEFRWFHAVGFFLAFVSSVSHEHGEINKPELMDSLCVNKWGRKKKRPLCHADLDSQVRTTSTLRCPNRISVQAVSAGASSSRGHPLSVGALADEALRSATARYINMKVCWKMTRQQFKHLFELTCVCKMRTGSIIFSIVAIIRAYISSRERFRPALDILTGADIVVSVYIIIGHGYPT